MNRVPQSKSTFGAIGATRTASDVKDSPFGLAKSSDVREKERVETRKAARGPKAETAEEDAANNTPNMVAFMIFR